jgi:hypothetical protein
VRSLCVLFKLYMRRPRQLYNCRDGMLGQYLQPEREMLQLRNWVRRRFLLSLEVWFHYADMQWCRYVSESRQLFMSFWDLPPWMLHRMRLDCTDVLAGWPLYMPIREWNQMRDERKHVQ